MKRIKCIPMDLVLLSNPPQNKCKNCGQHWYTSHETPSCLMQTPKIKSEEEMRSEHKSYFHCATKLPDPLDIKNTERILLLDLSADYWLSIIKEREEAIVEEITKRAEESEGTRFQTFVEVLAILKQTK